VSNISYTIISSLGKKHIFKRKACFSHLRELNKGIHTLTKGKWGSLKDDPLAFIVIYPENVGKLDQKVIDKWLRYLYNHHYWGKLLVKGTKGITIRVGGSSGTILLALCTIIRYINECPNVLKSFYNITSLDYVENYDIAMMLSLLIYVEKGKILEQRCKGGGGGFNTNHHLINEHQHTLGDITQYATKFPYKSQALPYNKTYNFMGTFDYFSVAPQSKKLTTVISELINSKDRPLEFKKLVLEIQEEVSKYVKED